MKTVRDVLKNKNQQEVWSVQPKATVFEALALMGEKEIGALMVIDEQGKVAGIISERDYARKVILKGKASRDTAVKEIMTPVYHMYKVMPENTVDECMVLITGKRIRHIPVFDGDGFIGLGLSVIFMKSVLDEKDTLIEQLSNYIAGKYT
jgi:CBS domain-containing protein